MNIYQMMHGVNPATFLILPMLGKHPDEYPRFRDCFITKDDHILVLTRVGGTNRNCGYGEEVLEQDPLFVKTYDAEDDSSYGFYEFKVPEQWQADFKVLKEGGKPSKEYLDQMCKVYPKLEEKFRNAFSDEGEKKETPAPQVDSETKESVEESNL